MKLHKNISFLIFTIAFFQFFSLGYYLAGKYFNKNRSDNILSSKTESFNKNVSISVIPTMKLTQQPSITPIPTKKALPTIIIIPQPKIMPEEIHRLMERFSGQYGIDVNILRHVAVCESGFNPAALNGKYAGLYQFDKNTWIKARRLMGEDENPNLRLNAEESIQTAAYLLSLGKKYLWPNCYP